MSEQPSTAARSRLPAGLAAMAAATRNGALRRVLLAFIGFSLAEWGTWIAILVYAYGQGGATETGVVALIQLAPAAVVAPLAASIGDRFPRDRALRIAYGTQAITMGAAAVALLAGAPNPLIYAAAVVATSSVTLTRPVQAAILPSLARTPRELTAANLAASTVETVSILIGPLLTGLALAVAGAGVVFLGSAAATLIGALLLRPVREDAFALAGDLHPEEEPTREAGADGLAAGLRQAAGETLAGLVMLGREERPRSVVGLLGAAAVLWGALDVFLVVLAIDLLAIGQAGVGYLNAALGAGGLVGAGLSVVLIGRSRLAVPFALGIGLWGAALAAVGAVPEPLVIGLLLALAGIGRVVMEVAGRTLLQRVAPEQMLARVFGLLEGIGTASLAVGSILAPALIGLLSVRGAMAVAGSVLLLGTAASWRSLLRTDASGVARPRELAVLRRVPIFAPLSPPALERLAASLMPVSASAGSAIIRQGEHGDRFFVILAGAVRVLVDGRQVREQGPGESFGEIALLRNVARTATVEAVGSVELLALERRAFLEAVTGQPASSAAAEAVVDERLEARA